MATGSRAEHRAERRAGASALTARETRHYDSAAESFNFGQPSFGVPSGVKFEQRQGGSMQAAARGLRSFTKHELQTVERAHAEAAAMVTGFYVLTPREQERINYEVRTLNRLAPEEVVNHAFAEVRCYDYVRRIGAALIARHDFYRICVQDHRILHALDEAQTGERLRLEPMLLYILTHELVHVVRFSRQMQRIDLAPELREQEEQSVEQTTRRILAPIADKSLRRVIEVFDTQE